ncbi:DUF599 domain-containing protein [Lamprobacter modestohalophilus]|uniref:DUF599 domain-containing protein n=1 Tax=Lamprobacter modestohalophilus TaxID=1064514 RepID=UPI002ADEE6D0|nr:DUF599 domain-containing protein [Lamprobacter modestohalophilus]MEA1049521.1 DUF599 domain-containing protein [Lamprobacter modestohalophilus]
MTDVLSAYSDLTLELALSGTAGGLLIGYHLIHSLEVRYWPARTSLGRNNRARARWASNVMARGADILAVQTLRNWTMAATFLASTAIVIGLGILSFALTYEGLDQLNNIFHIAGIRSHKLAVIKALLVVLVFLIAFVSFSLCVRFYNHAAFLLNLPRDDQALPLDSDAAIRALSRGASAYNLGMRCYYVAIPLALWLLGPIWFLAGALVMTMLIYRLDHGLG